MMLGYKYSGTNSTL